ncbi:hypothetical protein D7X55_35700 [Corallococcus sp. AB049A]|uniref:Transporter n=1 Tax=Corallococcus interemptor TaxID=2316720 RepID=A0A3A8PQU1_9BACT|nr:MULTISPECIES: hypothetical protein [Corallococcus]RKH46887.1 hypothetical protein D7Y23_22945 [Corallococcus sp. AB050B]RKH58827.1 hypothetical protein D7X96_36355 [Corallococcus interemptor]RKI49482.1 hypothetical protein D7X55_35700 [Corallococcus sp. AB049A]
MPANVFPQRPTSVRAASLSKTLTRAALLAVLSLGTPVAAQQPQPPITEDVPPPVQPPLPDSRVYFTTLNVVRYNPLGLESQNRLVYQKRLFDSPSLLLRDTYASAGASLKLSPAFFKLGPTVELQPVAMFNLRAGYEYVQFFGTFGSVQSYPDSFQSYDDDLRSKTNDAAYGTSGHHFFVEPMLQAKVKSVALRTKLAIEYWNVSLRDGGPRGTFYDPTLDTLVPGKGWVLANDTDLLWLAGQWTLGARFSAVWPRYDEDTAAVEPLPGRTLPNNAHMRVGPLVAYSFDTKPGGLMSKPTVLLIAGWYLKHENRVNAMPYLLGGFSFTTELLSGR